FLLVDLRCHGDSASILKTGPHNVSSTALDVLKLLGHLKITPRVIIGHSFGGKVALSMVEQAAKPLPRPVRVWVLDATPGKVRAGRDGDDHPAELITFLSAFPNKVVSKGEVIQALVREGFSNDVAQWVVTNLRQTNPSDSSSGFSWIFDLDGIAEMYQSYEDTNLWDVGGKLYLEARIHAAEEQASLEGGGAKCCSLKWRPLVLVIFRRALQDVIVSVSRRVNSRNLVLPFKFLLCHAFMKLFAIVCSLCNSEVTTRLFPCTIEINLATKLEIKDYSAHSVQSYI
ncbi:protein ABHD11 isoform X1, partial [Tanacetum coccineum]